MEVILGENKYANEKSKQEVTLNGILGMPEFY